MKLFELIACRLQWGRHSRRKQVGLLDGMGSGVELILCTCGRWWRQEMWLRHDGTTAYGRVTTGVKHREAGNR